MNAIQSKIGLVLGGGGVRGLANIGVLKVLEAENIPVSFLTGSSIGGLIAAAYAMGRTTIELEEEALRMTKTSRLLHLVDIASPWSGIIDGNRLREYLAKLVGAQSTFADTHIPLALIAVDLATGELLTLKEGSLLDAVQAAVTIPGLMSPVIWGDRVLIDGGILNNVPVGVVKQLGAQKTIAVDLNPGIDKTYIAPGNRSENTWPPFFPGFARDLYTAEMIMVNALTGFHLVEDPPDLLLKPQLPAGVSVFWGFHHAKETIAAGEKAAREMIPDFISPGSLDMI
jgi:NTE family protein